MSKLVAANAAGMALGTPRPTRCSVAPSSAVRPAASPNPITAVVGIPNANPEYFCSVVPSPNSSHRRKPNKNITTPNRPPNSESVRSRVAALESCRIEVVAIGHVPLLGAETKLAARFPRPDAAKPARPGELGQARNSWPTFRRPAVQQPLRSTPAAIPLRGGLRVTLHLDPLLAHRLLDRDVLGDRLGLQPDPLLGHSPLVHVDDLFREHDLFLTVDELATDPTAVRLADRLAND